MAITGRKTRDVKRPYAVFTNTSGFTYRILKFYGDPTKPYARVFLATNSPFTHGSLEMGDGYVTELVGSICTEILGEPAARVVYDTGSIKSILKYVQEHGED